MEGENRRSPSSAPVALAGAALVLMVLLWQGGRFLAGLLFAGLSAPAEGAPEGAALRPWLVALVNLVVTALTLVPPYFLLKSLLRDRKKLVPTGAGRVPVTILLPLFFGLITAANSLSNLLQAGITALFQLPAAEVSALPEGFLARFIYFLSACVLAPVFEELVFRGYIQGLLRAFGPRLAIWVTAALFTLMHAGLWELPTVFLLGLALCYVREVAGSVRPCIILHFANNAFVFLLAVVREKMDGVASLALVFWLMLLFIAMFVAALWAVRRFGLGKRFFLRPDPPLFGVERRLLVLLKTPLFALGVVAVVTNFVLGVVNHFTAA